MKKFALVAGLGMLATCGAVFATWSFNTSGTTFEEQAKNVTVTIDTDVTHTGNHGTLAMTVPQSLPQLYISQNEAHGNSAALKTRTGAGTNESPYAYANYIGSEAAQNALCTLEYKPAKDEDEPSIYTLKVNWKITLSSNDTDVRLSNSEGSLYVSQNHLSDSISLNDLLSRVTFPDNLTNYNTAKAFADKIPADFSIGISFTSATLVKTLSENGYGYSINNGDVIPMTVNPVKSYEYMATGVTFRANDKIQIHEKNKKGEYNYPLTPKEDEGNKVSLGKDESHNTVAVAGTYGIYVDTRDPKSLWIS